MKQNRIGVVSVWTALAGMGVCPSVFAQTGVDPATGQQASSVSEAPAGSVADAEVDASSAAADGTSADASSGGIAEIIVTAQRREQSLQNVPISISAITAESLESRGVGTVDELSGVSPGLTVTRQLTAVTPYIRGIGNANSSGGQESSVALYVDGIYMPQMPALNFSFNNIKRVEVLKGPQGTLFGRNATGGLIQIVTQDPVSTPTLRLDSSYGNYQTLAASAYGSIGVAQDLAADVAMVYSDQGQGYGRNLTTGKDTNRSRELGLRSTWLYQPEEATQVRLSLDYSNINSTKGVARRAAPGARTGDGEEAPRDFWDIREDYEPSLDLEGYGAGLKVSHDFDAVRFVSLTGYRYDDTMFFNDQDGTPDPTLHTRVGDKSRMVSQELQLLSNGTQGFNWIVGLFYFDYDVDYLLDVTGSSQAAAGGESVVRTSFDTNSYSAYAQGTFELPAAVNLTLGARYTEDRRKFGGAATTGSGLVIPSSSPDHQNAGEPTWRVALDHRFTGSMMGFFSYNRGFKSGVYNAASISAKPVDAEKVDAYELGLKTDWLDRRLRLNASAFYYDYQNLQVQQVVSGTQILQNAAGARIDGAEVELTALPVERLELSLSLAWLDTEYTKYKGAQITEPKPAPAGGNYVCQSGQTTPSASCPADVLPELAAQTAKGNNLVRAPKFTTGVTVQYSIPTGVGMFVASGSYNYNGGFYWEPDNRAKQDSYGLLNARFAWTTPSDRYSVYLFGRNLSNEKYSASFSGGAADFISAQPPRTFGAGFQLRLE